MIIDSEKVMTALFDRLSALKQFTTISRRLKLWASVPTSQKPALFIVERGDNYLRGNESVSESVVKQVEIYVYADVGKAEEIIPSSILNLLTDAVIAELEPNRLTGLQTLGGVVSNCWVEGKVMKDAGDLDGDGVAVIPVKILIPDSVPSGEGA